MLPPHFTIRQKLISWVGFASRHIIAVGTGFGVAVHLAERIHPGWSVIAGIAVWYIIDYLMAVIVAYVFLIFGGDFNEREIP